MMRSFPTRLVDSVTRVALLTPCLLTCLACATPFAIENLEEGMTAETVRENFGAPRASEPGPSSSEASWTYVHETLAPWPLTVGPMPLRVAVASIVQVLCVHVCLVASYDMFGDWRMLFVEKEPVVLHFEEEKLAGWEVLPSLRFEAGTGGGYHSGWGESSVADSMRGHVEHSNQAVKAYQSAIDRYKAGGLSQSELRQINSLGREIRHAPNAREIRAIRHKIEKVGK